MTTLYDYHAVLDRVFQAGGRDSVTSLAKEHGWGRARFVRVVEELEDAGYVEMNIECKGAIVSHRPFATRKGIIALYTFNGESYESIVNYIADGRPVYDVDAPFHNATRWKERGVLKPVLDDVIPF